MGKFIIGEKVVQKRKTPFEGLKDKIGTVKKSSRYPFLHYVVTYRGRKGQYEFHRGELRKAKPSDHKKRKRR